MLSYMARRSVTLLTLAFLIAGCAPAVPSSSPDLNTGRDPSSPPEQARDKQVIRVGLIRCDTHGAYYAVLMDEHDPLKLRGPGLTHERRTRYSWQDGAAYFYHYQRYANPTRMTSRRVPGFRITRVWDHRRDAAEVLSEVFYGKPEVCDTFAEVSDDVDLVFIADCNGDGSDHLKLAAPGLRKGVPTFIDKPLACSLEDALAIVRLAEETATPITSLSILRTVPQAERFRQRFDEIGGANFGIIKGGGSILAGQIHAISLAQHIFGDGVRSVSCMGEQPLAFIHLDYGRRHGRPRAGVMLNCASGRSPHSAFYASAYGRSGAIHTPPIDDFAFPSGATRNLELIKQMVQTGKPPMPYDEIVETIAVVEAARRSQELGRAVELSEVWQREQ